MKFKSFETDRMIIRPTALEDAAFVLVLCNTPRWIQYIGDRDIKTEKDAQEYINTRMVPQLKRLGYSSYTLIRKKDQLKIGVCGLYDRDGLDGIDLGFALLPEFEGVGYAYEASKRIRDAAFNEFNIETLLAITTKDNVASQKLLGKLGLQLTSATSLPNNEEELLVYSVSRERSQ